MRASARRPGSIRLNTHDVEQTIRVNVLGVIYSIEAVLPGMIARKSGHLLAISSLGAFKGLPGESAYCASKAAVNAYMEGLRIALRSKGVVVTTVCPGFVETPMTPMDSATPFLMSADAAARRIARLDRPAAWRRGSLSAADVALDVAHRPAAGRDRRPARSGRARRRAGRGRRSEPDDRPGPQDAARRKGSLRGHRVRRRVRGRLDSDPGGPVLRTARERQHHDRTAQRRPLGDGAEHAQRRFRQPIPGDLRSARAVDPRRGAGRQPDRLVRDRGVADRSERVGDLLRTEGLFRRGIFRGMSSRATRPISAAAVT